MSKRLQKEQEKTQSILDVLEEHFSGGDVAKIEKQNVEYQVQTIGTAFLRQRIFVPIQCVSQDMLKQFTFNVPVVWYDEVFENGKIVLKRHTLKKEVCTYKISDDNRWVAFLARDIEKLAKNFGHLDIEDQRSRKPLGIPGLKFTGTLKPEQQEAITQFTTPVNLPGIVMCKPGWGKTVFMIKYLVMQNFKTLVLVDKKTLIDQFISRLRQFTNINELEEQTGKQLVGKLKKTTRKGVKKFTTFPITVITYQLINVNMDIMDQIQDEFGLVINDECHKAGAKSLTQILSSLNSSLILGASATPYRADGLDAIFNDLLGPIRFRGKDENEIDVTVKRGYGVPNRNYPYPSIITKKLVKISARNFDIARDVSLEAQKFQFGKKCLVLSQTTDHCKVLNETIQDNFPEVRTAWVASTVQGNDYLFSLIDRIQACFAIRKLIEKNTDAMSHLQGDDKDIWDFALTARPLLELAQKYGCPQDLLHEAVKLGRQEIDIIVSTEKAFAEAIDAPILSHVSIAFPTGGGKNGKLLNQIGGRASREIILPDGRVNPWKPRTTMFYYADRGPFMLAGMKKGFINKCRDKGFAVHDETETTSDSRDSAFIGLWNN